MTSLDEAIKHYDDVAEKKEKEAWEAQLQEEYKTSKSCKECAKEHRQLAEWLKELKFYRTMIPSASEYFRTGKVDAK